MSRNAYAVGYQELTGHAADVIEVGNLGEKGTKTRAGDDPLLTAVHMNGQRRRGGAVTGGPVCAAPPSVVGAVHDTHKTIEHPDLGRLDLDCDVLTVDGADVRVVVFTAAPGTVAADSLALLASLEVRRAAIQ